MNIIGKVHAKASIVEVARAYTRLEKRGLKYLGLCPLHTQKEPSFVVDSEKRLFYCFDCGVGGDVFALVMGKERLAFPEALSLLASRLNIELPPPETISYPKKGACRLIAGRLKDGTQPSPLAVEGLHDIISRWAHNELSDTEMQYDLEEFLYQLRVNELLLKEWREYLNPRDDADKLR